MKCPLHPVTYRSIWLICPTQRRWSIPYGPQLSSYTTWIRISNKENCQKMALWVKVKSLMQIGPYTVDLLWFSWRSIELSHPFDNPATTTLCNENSSFLDLSFLCCQKLHNILQGNWLCRSQVHYILEPPAPKLVEWWMERSRAAGVQGCSRLYAPFSVCDAICWPNLTWSTWTLFKKQMEGYFWNFVCVSRY